MNKKGLSNVVVTVLLILLVIAAIVIIWAFLRPVLIGQGGRITSDQITARFEISKEYVFDNCPDATFAVRRNTGAGSVVAVITAIEDSYGNTISKRVNGSFQELESKVLNMTYNNSNLRDVKRIKVMPILLDRNGKEMQGLTYNSPDLNFDKDLPLLNQGIYQGLVTYLKFDEICHPGIDYSGNKNKANLRFNSKIVEEAINGKSLYLDGSGDQVYVPNNKFLNDSNLNNSFTYSAWIKFNGTSTNYNGVFGVEGNKENESNSNISRIDLNLDGQVRCRFDTVEGLNKICTSIGNVLDNEWHHVALTYNGSVAKLYFDYNQTSIYTSPGSLIYQAPFILIGSGKNIGTNAWFNGTIDEMMIWNRALSDQEIEKLFELDY